MKSSASRGFALPTVLIAGIVMMIVLMTALVAASGGRANFDSQYYTRIANEAAESGLIAAQACIDDGTITWANPLRPGSGCSGATTNSYMMQSDTMRVTFAVATPSSPDEIINSTGTVELLRKSNGMVWRTYTRDIKQLDQGGLGGGGGGGGPIVLSASSTVTMGEDHTCAIASDNNAYCWGDNGDGQLGRGAGGSSNTPVPVSTSGVLSGLSILAISAGESHTCAIASDNNAYCWGDGSDGKLGRNSTSSSNVPVAVTRTGALNGLSILQIAAAERHTCALASDNNVYCWGRNGNEGMLGRNISNTSGDSMVPVAVHRTGELNGLHVLQLSAGARHTCVVASNNRAYCWGYNNRGQIGDGSTTNRAAPRAVTVSGALSGQDVMQIGAGGFSTCAVASNSVDSRAYCWGYNNRGQLGDGSSTNRNNPVAVSVAGALSGRQIASVQAGSEYGTGGAHSCATDSDGNLYCWGDNDDGQLGIGSKGALSNVPLAVTSPLAGLQVTQMTLAESASCAITQNAALYCWGDNSNGQLGFNNGGGDEVFPVIVPGFTPAGGDSTPSAISRYYF